MSDFAFTLSYSPLSLLRHWHLKLLWYRRVTRVKNKVFFLLLIFLFFLFCVFELQRACCYKLWCLAVAHASHSANQMHWILPSIFCFIYFSPKSEA